MPAAPSDAAPRPPVAPARTAAPQVLTPRTPARRHPLGVRRPQRRHLLLPAPAGNGRAPAPSLAAQAAARGGQRCARRRSRSKARNPLRHLGSVRTLVGPWNSSGNFKDALIGEIAKAKAVFYNMVVAQAQKIEVTGDRVVFSFTAAQRALKDQFEQQKTWLEVDRAADRRAQNHDGLRASRGWRRRRRCDERGR